MRRSEREITCESEIRALLESARVVRLAFAVGDEPYLVPLSYGYDAELHALCFHTARTGKKIEFIERNPRVCFEIEGSSAVRRGSAPCSWSLDYESLIGYGTVSEVTEMELKVRALRCLMRQHAGEVGDEAFGPQELSAVRVWRISIESLTGKRSTPRPN
jgi:uncharacterized protein